jgi:hypothetical protein
MTTRKELEQKVVIYQRLMNSMNKTPVMYRLDKMMTGYRLETGDGRYIGPRLRAKEFSVYMSGLLDQLDEILRVFEKV